jgi:hypothetical protein
VKNVPPIRSCGSVILVTDGSITRVAEIEEEYRFAFGLKNAARVMANSARRLDEPDGHEMRAFVTGAVSLSYSYLEAALNEFIHLNAKERNSPLNEHQKILIAAIASEDLRPQKRQHTLQLFNMILRLVDKPQLDETKEPYQSANLVRKLRNVLVHPVPGRVKTYVDGPDSILSGQQQIVGQLRSLLGLHPDAAFPFDVLTCQCAAWAVHSCEHFLAEFVRVSEVNPGFVTEQLYGYQRA